jgi:predicted DNA-binding ribbon-helix-helix protein
MKKSRVIKRSIVLDGHKTSVSLEDEFWTALKEIAAERDETVSGLVEAIDAARENTNLSSAIRLFVLVFYRGQHADYHGQTRKETSKQLVAAPLTPRRIG